MSEPTEKILNTMKFFPKKCFYSVFSSPVGDLTLIASKERLHELTWKKNWQSQKFVEYIDFISENHQQKHILKAKQQLAEYFLGERQLFDVPLVLYGTEFQKQAWMVLREIPYGTTISYQEQAVALGDKNKMRAVGGANGRNPISIIMPCHRVIAKNGKLQGFGGGLDIKQFLLDHEKSYL